MLPSFTEPSCFQTIHPSQYQKPERQHCWKKADLPLLYFMWSTWLDTCDCIPTILPLQIKIKSDKRDTPPRCGNQEKQTSRHMWVWLLLCILIKEQKQLRKELKKKEQRDIGEREKSSSTGSSPEPPSSSLLSPFSSSFSHHYQIPQISSVSCS